MSTRLTKTRNAVGKNFHNTFLGMTYFNLKGNVVACKRKRRAITGVELKKLINFRSDGFFGYLYLHILADA